MNRLILLFVSMVGITAVSCRQNHYRVRLTQEVEVKIERLEMDLLGSDPGSVVSSVGLLQSRYGDFLRLFGYVINIGEPENPEWEQNLVLFSGDRTNREVYRSVMEIFPSVTWLEEELSSAWSHYLYYFPDSAVPRLFTCITGFNNSIIVGRSEIGIGLDRYMGSDSRYYSMLGIYNYERRFMIPEKIPSDCMYAWASATWPASDRQEESATLLSSMIHEGKLLYFTRSMLPVEPDTLIFGFTGDQMKFCLNNERQMWEYLLEYDLMFISDDFTIRKFTGQAPFTSAFTRESPGRAASWLGFRIVEEYMRRNRDITLEELMGESDPSVILSGAQYFPGK
ncbi:MAG: hypothetical protein ABR519_02170 [Bacteroidales bacterium]